MGMGGQRHVLATLSLEKRAGTHCTGGWVGHRAGLDVLENRKSLAPASFRRLKRPVQ